MKYEETTTIRIRIQTKDALLECGTMGQTYDDVIRQLIQAKRVVNDPIKM